MRPSVHRKPAPYVVPTSQSVPPNRSAKSLAFPPPPPPPDAAAPPPSLEAEPVPDEAELEAEEWELMRKAEALEREVAEHKAAKEAAREARRRADERHAAEAALQRWQSELRAETEVAIARLNEQRAAQLTKCAEFEAKLQANIEAMQAMQVQVRRRAAAIDTAFDATVARLSGSYTDAVACMAEQVAAAGVAALR
jgi:colicin import membrane protein